MLPSSTISSSSGKYEDRIGNDTETSSTRELTIQNSNSSNSLDQTTSRLSSPSASTSSSVSGASLGWKLDWEHRYDRPRPLTAPLEMHMFDWVLCESLRSSFLVGKMPSLCPVTSKDPTQDSLRWAVPVGGSIDRPFLRMTFFCSPPSTNHTFMPDMESRQSILAWPFLLCFLPPLPPRPPTML